MDVFFRMNFKRLVISRVLAGFLNVLKSVKSFFDEHFGFLEAL
jgi:hypothetical protein